VVLVIGVIDKQNFQLMRSLTKERSNQERISNSLKEKEIMLSEIHHRVKNNLAIITSLLNLQLNATTNEEAKKLLIDSRNRVLSMSMAHQRLYDKKNFSKIDFARYLEDLINELIDASPLKNHIVIKADCVRSEVELTKAVPVGLIVNEIITNSIKHAFPEGKSSPQIQLSMERKAENLEVLICDNGIGFEREVLDNENSLGLSLIDSLVEQIDGKLIYENLNGARYRLVVPCQ
jgi:two-component sensor histidine kinase